MSRLTDLIARAKSENEELGKELEQEFKIFSSRRAFGLNFERHNPESIELPDRPIRRGEKVHILPPRGKAKLTKARLWKVVSISKKGGMAKLKAMDGAEPQETETALDDLVVVAEFEDAIYPGLVSTGKVEQGDDKPFHTVINGENFHALEALTFTHRHKIDAIYIDPPYNSGARDWKYNNHYVDETDSYRHSKWLAMMERRLLVAKELLNPKQSVLIVTIDEKEYLRLGLLLEQLFPEAQQQMISTVIKPSGSPRRGLFSRADEYIYFVLLGSATVHSSSTDMLRHNHRKSQKVRWRSLLRSAENGQREARPNLFWPIFLDKITGGFVRVGEKIPIEQDRKTVALKEGEIILWPLGKNDEEFTWSLSNQTFLQHKANGYVRFGPWDGTSRAPYYLTSGRIKDIESDNGKITVLGKDCEGALKIEYGSSGKEHRPLTVWHQTSHSATEHGTGLLKFILPNHKFPFPKSLYAVEDTLRFFVADNPNAIILDFFAGSGTTAHAVMRLNRQDGGKRQSISITNNEVSDKEAKALTKQKLRQGDAGWEKWGICDYITKPRIKASITGKTPEGKAIKGDYKFTDEFPMADGFEENAVFFNLTYETPVAIQHNLAFERIAPLLWMRAGSIGRQISNEPEAWDIAETYAVLTDLDHAQAFIDAVSTPVGIRIVYIVTDDDWQFQSVAQSMPKGIEAVRLYENYLANFQFATGGRA